MRPFVLGIFAVTVSAATVLGISFPLHGVNIAVVLLAAIGSGRMALLAFNLRPKWLGTFGCFVAGVGWSFAAIVMLFGLLSSLGETSRTTVLLDDSLHCQQTAYGFVGTDSGFNLTVFRRLLFLDHEILHFRRSQTYPELQKDITDAEKALVQRCDKAFENAIRKFSAQ